jgi:hypothetical protein
VRRPARHPDGVHSRGSRSSLRPAAAGFGVAGLALLVVLAMVAPERREAPRSGEFAAAGRQRSLAAHGATAARAGAFSLHFRIAGSEPQLTRLRVHSRLPCTDGGAIDDDVAVALPAATVAGHGAFDVDAGGVRLHGFFVAPDRATGTLTRTVGHCAIADARWTARPAG